MPETLIGKVVRRQSWMDPLSDSVQKLVSSSYRALGAPGPALRNLMHGTVLLRHPLHPAVTDVPIGAWTVSVIADYVAHFTSRVPESAGDIALAVGLVVALLALITGYTDFADTIGLERRFGCAHGLLMTVVVLVDVVSLALRWWGSDGVHPLAVALSTVALLVLLLGAWLGGHVVFGIGYGVNHAAFLDGPEDWANAGPADAVPEQARYDQNRPETHEVVRAMDRGTRERRDDVAAPQAGGGGGSAALYGSHQRAVPGGGIAGLHTEVGPLDRAAALEYRDDGARRVRGHGEADPDVPSRSGRLDLRVDPHDMSRLIEQRAARVAGVDRRVGLDRRVDLEPVGSLDVPPEP